MLTLFHSPLSRSSRIVRLLHELDKQDEVNIHAVSIPRQDGSGCVDPSNPHPEGKVPFLVHDGNEVWESNAIILYLTDLFPSELGPLVGSPLRGRYLSWLAYYGNVVEPVLLHEIAKLSHPVLDSSFRGLAEFTQRLTEALEENDYLLGDHFSAADLLMVSPFSFMPDLVPDEPAIRRWIDRCQARPAVVSTNAFDQTLV